MAAGMVFTIEPTLVYGSPIYQKLSEHDDWSIVTKDNRPSAHHRHTVLITEDGCDVLTKIDD